MNLKTREVSAVIRWLNNLLNIFNIITACYGERAQLYMSEATRGRRVYFKIEMQINRHKLILNYQ